ncbi:MAG: hypothetical protein H0X51_09890 [Parachlamydiaceae bacterium]|nr:hypothetical protein [Parachlamydiaceae bacterium]
MKLSTTRSLIRSAILSLLIGSMLYMIVLLLQSYTISIPQPQVGKDTEFYANQSQDDLTQVFTTAIRQANRSVLLIVYSLTDRAVINALQQKSEEGIPVQVICDAKATSSYLESKLGSKVQFHRRYQKGIMHQKLLVVDGEKIWIGSANMTSESLRMHGNLVNSFYSQELAQAVQDNADHMVEETNKTIPGHRVFKIGNQTVEFSFLPQDRDAIHRLKSLIASAQKSIRIAMFTWTRYDLAHAIVDASKRGVSVEVVLDAQSGKGASAPIAQFLLSRHIPVRFSKGNALLHHKFLYIDQSLLVNGSTNWTKAAFTKNEDCFIILHDLNEQQQQKMDRLWQAIVRDSTPMRQE